MICIHDPIHSTIELTAREIQIVDCRVMQRLRDIKQLGLASLAFPGATHTRFAHSIGAMAMATRMFDHLASGLALHDCDALRFRQTVRLAVLLHDLGHAPMSHVSERWMPPVEQLGLNHWLGDVQRRATHEDYTLKLLIDSELTRLIDDLFGDLGVSANRVAALLIGHCPPDDAQAFWVDGSDFLPLLRQLVSGEMDADRMDYLQRDAYYCGVNYGKFDHDWLVRMMCVVDSGNAPALALQHKGVWAFENFLLARYHMFLSVYYHHTTLCLDHFLTQFFQDEHRQLPADIETYLQLDDISLMHSIRQSTNIWAARVAQRKPYPLLVETHEYSVEKGQYKTNWVEQSLNAEGIEYFTVRSHGILSQYFPDPKSPLLVLEPEIGRVSRLEEYTSLYRQFESVVGVSRVFCHPGHLDKARRLICRPETNAYSFNQVH